MQRAFWTLWAVILFTIAGCSGGGIKLELQYDDLAGIQKGDRVFQENELVGVVTKVAKEAEDEGSGSVFVSLNQKKAGNITENTRFYIDPDPEKGGRQAIVLKQYRSGGTALASGAVVKGSDRSLSVFHELTDELGAGFGSLKAFFGMFKDDLEKGSESELAKKIEKELDLLAQKLGESSEKWKEQFEKEVLPELEKKIESLLESLERLGQSEEAQELKRKLEVLTKT